MSLILKYNDNSLHKIEKKNGSIKIFSKIYSLSNKLVLYFSINKSLLYLKGFYGMFILKLPSYYFFKNNNDIISLLFLKKYYYMSFLKHFFYLYNRLFIIYCIRLKIKGLGYRIRKVADNLYYFFFNYTNMYYMQVPKNILVKWYKKRIIFLSNDFFLLKLLFSNILLLKKLGPYRLRGLRYPRQIILLKKSGKTI